MSKRKPYEYDDFDENKGRKRRRFNSEQVDPGGMVERLESLIIRVGEKSTVSLEKNLETLADVVEHDLHVPSHKMAILRILGDCIVKMPEKITIYTTLVGLLNSKNFEFSGDCVDLLTKKLKDSLKNKQFGAARGLVQFFADLVNCRVICVYTYFTLLENMYEASQEENIPQVRSDWFTYTILSALPWVGRELYEKKKQELDHLLNNIETYLNKRKKIHTKGLRVWQSDTPHPQEEYLDCLWAQISKMRNDNWVEHHVVRPYMAFDEILCEALQHKLPNITMPPHEENTEYPYPYVVFRMFDYTDCPEGPVLPGAHAIERNLMEEQVRRIIHQYCVDRKECAAQLLSFPGRNKIPIDYVLVEVIFSEIFNLPSPPQLEIVYGSLLLELCKLQPSTMPLVLAQMTELIYQRIDTMNIDCIERFASWFAYHLSNFRFVWTWDDWKEAISMDPLHPKAKFVFEALQKCLRLTYYERLTEMIPTDFTSMMPNEPKPDYKYEKEGAADLLPGTAVAHVLASAIKSKCTSEEALQIIDGLANPLQEDDSEAVHNPLKIDVFVQTLLKIANKSISHMFAAVAKFHPVLKSLASTEEAQMCILRAMFEVWHDHQQKMCVLVDKLLRIKVIESCAVANWIFSKEMSTEFPKMYIWEILHSTVCKIVKNVQKLENDLSVARSKLDKSDDEMDSEKEGENATEEMVEKMEEELESAQSELKNIFLVIFQRFIMILTEHIARCELEEKDFKNHWYNWTIGRLQQVFHWHHEHVFKYVSTLESLLFTSDVDPNILSVFQQFCAMKE